LHEPTKGEKIGALIALLLLLYLLFKKNPLKAKVSSKLVDSSTGLYFGYGGVRNDPLTIGEILPPPGILNDIANSGFQYHTRQSLMASIPLCPDGYDPIIDPNNNKSYCILAGHGSSIGG